jgi:hypothetical protein
VHCHAQTPQHLLLQKHLHPPRLRLEWHRALMRVHPQGKSRVRQLDLSKLVNAKLINACKSDSPIASRRRRQSVLD